ncbi:MAG: response regulator [Candidatus Omnitrophica bacterium]|nr:response regulator [Candidatus Omnitrophota bacterium]
MFADKTLLIIDDEEDLLEVTKYEFEANGFRVFTARNGVEGLEQLRKIKPDLILLDMNMPKMGGVEFFKNICDAQGTPKHPVFVLTARAHMEDFFKGFDIDGFLPKPFEIDELVKKVTDIIKSKSKQLKLKEKAVTEQAPSVCIVEDNEQKFQAIAGQFLKAGYTVHPSFSGHQAIDRIAHESPDVVIVKLGLHDLQGDVVIAKLHKIMLKKNIDYVLYRGESGHNGQISFEMLKKTGSIHFIETDHPPSLLEEVNKIIK